MTETKSGFRSLLTIPEMGPAYVNLYSKEIELCLTSRRQTSYQGQRRP
jgi:hypothetical protein